MKRVDENTREYNPQDYALEEDKRFIQSKREMLQIHAMYFSFVFIEFLVAYGVFHFFPHVYIAGFPAWFAVGVLIALLFWGAVFLFLSQGIEDCSLAPKQEGENDARD